MCGATAGGVSLDGVDLTKETVIQGVVSRDDAPLAGAYVRLLDASGEFTAEVPTSTTGQYRITRDADGQYWLDRIDPGTLPQRHPPEQTLLHESHDKDAFMPLSPEAGRGADGPVVVDVMAFYTDAAVGEYPDEADLRLAIQNASDMTNTALLNSEVEHRIRLLGMIHWRHQEGASMADSLVSFRGNAAVARIRDRYSADLNGLFGLFSDFCGIAYVLMAYQNDWEFGYSANNVAAGFPCLEIQVFAHEMGHNMGLHHNPENSTFPPWQVIEPFAFGHYVEDQFSTIMSYHPGCGGGEYHNCSPSIDYFSNPAIDDPASGLTTGIENERDNAEVLRRTMPLAAGWREPPADPAAVMGGIEGSFRTEGTGHWVVQDQITFRGKPTLVSGPVYGDEVSRLVLEPGTSAARTMDFSVRAPGENSSGGTLTVYADGASLLSIENPRSIWTSHTVEIPENTGEVVWSWQSEGRPSVNDGLGIVYLSGETGYAPLPFAGRSGGCSLGDGRSADPLFPLLLLLVMTGLFGRRLSDS
jgi:hypothetical protein